MIPDSFKQDLLSRADIVSVVSQYVELKPAGREYKARCPFHEEKTPSFTVIPSKGFYHCFGCGANGDALDFVMNYRGYGFRAAVAELAGMVGMQIPDQGPTDVQKVKADQDNAAARRILEALEMEMTIAAIAVSDAIEGRPISEQDRERFRQALTCILRGIEAGKRRRLTAAERKHILGAEFPEQQEKAAA